MPSEVVAHPEVGALLSASSLGGDRVCLGHPALAAEAANGRWLTNAVVGDGPSGRSALLFSTARGRDFGSDLWEPSRIWSDVPVSADARDYVFVGGRAGPFAGLVSDPPVSGSPACEVALRGLVRAVALHAEAAGLGLYTCNAGEELCRALAEHAPGLVREGPAEFLLPVRGSSVEEHTAAQRSSVRQLLRRDRRQFEDQRLTWSVSHAATSTAETAALVNATLRRHGRSEPSRLTSMRVTEAARTHGDDLRVVEVRRSGVLEAVGLLAVHRPWLEHIEIGVRADPPSGVLPYLVALVHGPLEVAVDLGLRGVWLGYEADRPKLLRGSEARRRFSFLAGPPAGSV